MVQVKNKSILCISRAMTVVFFYQMETKIPRCTATHGDQNSYEVSLL